MRSVKATRSVFVSAKICMCICHHRMFLLTCIFLWYRNVGKSPEIRFVDFDWAGRAGHVFHPPFMNHSDDGSPPDIQEFAPALQKHDRHLLSPSIDIACNFSMHHIDMPKCVRAQGPFKWRKAGISLLAICSNTSLVGPESHVSIFVVLWATQSYWPIAFLASAWLLR